MSNPVIQTSFNAGEWAPALNARVDLSKYHSGAALLRNFFVDYRGGATARPGTKYILQTKSTSTVRLIPFQASFTVTYILEFGQGYVRFYNNGVPVLETATVISAINIGTSTITDTAHGYSNGDWVFINNIVGTVGTQLNGNYYIIAGATANTYTLTDLNGVAIAFTGAYTSGGTAQRVYTITSPYQSADLAQVKFSQNVNALILCHPNYPPQQLTLNSATNWTLGAITFGSTIAAPVGQSVASTLGAGSVNYAYVITSVDSNGQESGPSAFAALGGKLDLRSTAGTNTITWTAVTGAASYNVYKAEPNYAGAVPGGSQFGFIGNINGVSFADSNISPDFSQGVPVVLNPFAGSGVSSITLTNPGFYSSGSVPSVSFSGGGGAGAAALVTMFCASVSTTANGGSGYSVGQVVGIIGDPSGALFVITSVTTVGPFTGVINGIIVGNAGSLGSGPLPILGTLQATGGTSAGVNTRWEIRNISITSAGSGYSSAPVVAINPSQGGAAATCTIGAPSSGNPSVPGFYDQRLVLAGPVGNPQQINMSATGAYYNFNVHFPLEADDAFQGSLVSGQLNVIQSMIVQPQGLIILSDKQAWLLNGGSPGAPFGATVASANPQAYNGSSFIPPIVANDNILYVQSKGSIVRDLVFNFYTQVFTGTDISVLSSHLFYGFTILEWAFAEEPFKLIWAVRNDGQLLTLTFLKEQQLIAWAHSDTNGLFKSIAAVTETVSAGAVDAVYTVVQRVINGNTIQYVERMVELYYPSGLASAWCVDAGISFMGASTLSFAGAQHLAGATVTGIATDNNGNTKAITPFVMSTTGSFNLPAPALPATGYTQVLVGLAYLPQLQTLALDLGEPTVQSKRKKVGAVTVRTKETLGLSAGRTFSTLVPMKDLQLGNVGTMSNALVTGLQTTDARTIVDPQWDVFGQFCIQQSNPYPASVLGVIPEIEVGDTTK